MNDSIEMMDPSYPFMLRLIADPPRQIYVAGEVAWLNEIPCVAIIGARNPSEAGMRAAYRMGAVAAANGFGVVNGLALGCDTMALKGALKMGGRCAVTLPCGMNRIYPEQNRALAEEIVSRGGCLISEYPDDTGVEKWRFVERDRLQGGLALGVVAVETSVDGGTMHTAKFALRDSRLLGVYRSPALSRDDGNNLLIERYHAISIQSEKEFDGFINDLRFYKPQVARQLELDIEGES